MERYMPRVGSVSLKLDHIKINSTCLAYMLNQHLIKVSGQNYHMRIRL